MWLDLETLCLRPKEVQRLAVELGKRLAGYGVEMVCGPLVEGAFVALMVASEMKVEFVYAERFAPPSTWILTTSGLHCSANVRKTTLSERDAESWTS